MGIKKIEHFRIKEESEDVGDEEYKEAFSVIYENIKSEMISFSIF